MSDEEKKAVIPARFAIQKGEDVEKARKVNIPQKTQNDMKYCIRLWREWHLYRNVMTTEANEVVPDNLTSLDDQELEHWLCHFVLEV